jgi:hypothetical protein
MQAVIQRLQDPMTTMLRIIGHVGWFSNNLIVKGELPPELDQRPTYGTVWPTIKRFDLRGYDVPASGLDSDLLFESNASLLEGNTNSNRLTAWNARPGWMRYTNTNLVFKH